MKKGGWTSASLSSSCARSLGLELVTQCELHDARRTRGRCNDAERSLGAEASRCGPIEAGMVERIEAVPAELQHLLVGPRHRKLLGYAHVEVKQAWACDDIPVPDRPALRKVHCAQRIVNALKILQIAS